MRRHKVLRPIDGNSLSRFRRLLESDDEFSTSTWEKQLAASSKTPKISNCFGTATVASRGKPPKPQKHSKRQSKANATIRRRRFVKQNFETSNETVATNQSNLSVSDSPIEDKEKSFKTKRASKDQSLITELSATNHDSVSEAGRHSDEGQTAKIHDDESSHEDMECVSDSASLDSDLSSHSSMDESRSASTKCDDSAPLFTKKMPNIVTNVRPNVPLSVHKIKVSPLCVGTDIRVPLYTKMPMQQKNFHSKRKGYKIQPAFLGAVPNEYNRISKKFLGHTIGGDLLTQSDSLDGSEVTMPTLAEKKGRNLFRSRRLERGPVGPALLPLPHGPPMKPQDIRNNKIPQAYMKSEVSEQLARHSDSSAEVWSIEDDCASLPIKFSVDTKRYLHPPLPPGWKIKVSKSQKRPFYVHPDFGITWHCPVMLPQKAKNSNNGLPQCQGERQFQKDELTRSHLSTRVDMKDEVVSNVDDRGHKLETEEMTPNLCGQSHMATHKNLQYFVPSDQSSTKSTSTLEVQAANNTTIMPLEVCLSDLMNRYNREFHSCPSEKSSEEESSCDKSKSSKAENISEGGSLAKSVNRSIIVPKRPTLPTIDEESRNSKLPGYEGINCRPRINSSIEEKKVEAEVETATETECSEEQDVASSMKPPTFPKQIAVGGTLKDDSKVLLAQPKWMTPLDADSIRFFPSLKIEFGGGDSSNGKANATIKNKKIGSSAKLSSSSCLDKSKPCESSQKFWKRKTPSTDFEVVETLAHRRRTPKPSVLLKMQASYSKDSLLLERHDVEQLKDGKASTSSTQKNEKKVQTPLPKGTSQENNMDLEDGNDGNSKDRSTNTNLMKVARQGTQEKGRKLDSVSLDESDHEEWKSPGFSRIESQGSAGSSCASPLRDDFLGISYQITTQSEDDSFVSPLRDDLVPTENVILAKAEAHLQDGIPKSSPGGTVQEEGFGFEVQHRQMSSIPMDKPLGYATPESGNSKNSDMSDDTFGGHHDTLSNGTHNSDAVDTPFESGSPIKHTKSATKEDSTLSRESPKQSDASPIPNSPSGEITTDDSSSTDIESPPFLSNNKKVTANQSKTSLSGTKRALLEITPGITDHEDSDHSDHGFELVDNSSIGSQDSVIQCIDFDSEAKCGKESGVSKTTLSKHKPMGRRVLHPPHPLCSLQNLDAIFELQKKRNLEKRLPTRKKSKITKKVRRNDLVRGDKSRE